MYACLIILRLLAAVQSPAYIHPDEHFQSTEVAAADVLGVQTSQPWEFTAQHPARSAIGPAISCGISYWLLKRVLHAHWLGVRAVDAAKEAYGDGLSKSLAAALSVVCSGGAGMKYSCGQQVGSGDMDRSRSGCIPPSEVGSEWLWRADMTPPLAVVLAPRLFLFCASLLLDAAAAGAARAVYWARRGAAKSGSRRGSGSVRGECTGDWVGLAAADIHARLTLASCWPVLTMQLRPFSNSLEALVLALAVLLVLCHTSDRPVVTAVALGAITAVGVWIRFTFIFFAIPLGVHVVVVGGGGGGGGGHGGGARRAMRGLATALGGVTGALITACALVFVDTLYFRGGASVAEGLAAGPGAAAGAALASLRSVLSSQDETEGGTHGGSQGAAGVGAGGVGAGSSWVVSPWNSLWYNLRVENLAEHGLHPRGLHVGVNAPLMFGPLALAAYLALLTSLGGTVASLFRRGGGGGGGNGSGGKP
jgi:phosphatidylinositol glycan class Z